MLLKELLETVPETNVCKGLNCLSNRVLLLIRNKKEMHTATFPFFLKNNNKFSFFYVYADLKCVN